MDEQLDDGRERGDEVTYLPASLPRVSMPVTISPRMWELAAECAMDNAEAYRRAGAHERAEFFERQAARFRKYAQRAMQ